ncbi:hypothetical protein CVT24_004776 [Panaeolus cyanescens]|uniref:C2H2-type domain-containing protein n=1 Tax=Panaeolus cyanescens TaxID=181874 RepID=A0A409V9U8_9AGAR|nr:hypothetical protein CVT24_004776 [Panaeolus cyanescens]
MMQASSYAAIPLHPEYFTTNQHHNSQQSINDHYYFNDETHESFSNGGFSRGSSIPYPQQDYRYFIDRGEPPEFCSSSLVDSNLDATALGFAPNPSSRNSFAVPEGISAYHDGNWHWQALSNPPTYTMTEEVPYMGEKSSINHTQTSTPATQQVPTPAEMAMLLNPSSRSQEDSPTDAYEMPPRSATISTTHATPAVSRTSTLHSMEQVLAPQAGPEPHSREKKHPCSMCHKRFDRPSTLRKHLLVHTGEKAFVCDNCGRRFGVASNLNRHVKRCLAKPFNTSLGGARSSNSPPASFESSEQSLEYSSSSSMSPRKKPSTITTAPGSKAGKRGRAPNSPVDNNVISSSPPSAQSPPTAHASKNTSSPAPKRRRRATSPDRWVPASLRNFNLQSEASYQSTPVPLPPVRRNPPREERDSWDENVSHLPYHPCGWSGVLPGPGLSQGLGLGGKDVRNVNFGGRGGFMLGRVVVC